MTPAETQLETRIATLLDWLETTGRSAEAFAYEQAPLVAREIIAWQFWNGAIRAVAFFAVAMVLLLVAAKVSKAAWRQANDDKRHSFGHQDATFTTVTAYTVAGMFALFCVCAASSNALDAVQTVVAPRLVILDYVRGMR